MKKSKKVFMCALASVSLVSSFAMPTASNAIYHVQDSNSSELDALNNEEKYVKLEGKYKEFLIPLDYGVTFSEEQIAGTEIYAFKGSASFEKVIPLDKDKTDDPPAVFNLTEGTTKEQVNALLHEKYNSYFNITRYDHNSDYSYQFWCARPNFKEVCKLLKEAGFIESFVVPGGYFQIVECYTGDSDYSKHYPLSYYVTADEYEALGKYITENNLGELMLGERWSDGHSEVHFGNDNLETTEDILDVAIGIYETVGVYPSYLSPATNNTTQTGSIDVFNAVNGDANCDNELSIADSTLILQHVGNADKYKLSAQGEFNADVSGEYDGISAADAVAIQRFKVGAIDKLG